MAKQQNNDGRTQKQTQHKPRDGEPGSGSGVGRREEASGSGVYPMSLGPDKIPQDAELETQNQWGQGKRGAKGYEDSGQSELNYTEEEAEAYQREKQNRQAREKGGGGAQRQGQSGKSQQNRSGNQQKGQGGNQNG